MIQSIPHSAVCAPIVFEFQDQNGRIQGAVASGIFRLENASSCHPLTEEQMGWHLARVHSQNTPDHPLTDKALPVPLVFPETDFMLVLSEQGLTHAPVIRHASAPIPVEVQVYHAILPWVREDYCLVPPSMLLNFYNRFVVGVQDLLRCILKRVGEGSTHISVQKVIANFGLDREYGLPITIEEGDKQREIWRNWILNWESSSGPCPYCSGFGASLGQDGKPILCPSCQGCGRISASYDASTLLAHPPLPY